MNQADRKEIDELIDVLGPIRERVRELAYSLQERADNLRDTNFEERAESLEEEAYRFEEIADLLDEADEALGVSE